MFDQRLCLQQYFMEGGSTLFEDNEEPTVREKKTWK